jgi:hypothetical protein
MSQPIHVRATYVFPDAATTHQCNLNPNMPDTNYHISVEFPWDASSWWLTDKQTGHFDIDIVSAPTGNQNFFVEVYHDSRDGGA